MFDFVIKDFVKRKSTFLLNCSATVCTLFTVNALQELSVL